MTGFEMVHALQRDPELRQIPVIMLTARERASATWRRCAPPARRPTW